MPMGVIGGVGDVGAGWIPGPTGTSWSDRTAAISGLEPPAGAAGGAEDLPYIPPPNVLVEPMQVLLSWQQRQQQRQGEQRHQGQRQGQGGIGASEGADAGNKGSGNG